MQIYQPLPHNRTEKLFQITSLAVIAFGIILRASKYLAAFSMRGDELAITLNLLNHAAVDLITKPLDYEQAAPFGFVLLIKLLITLFGQSEYVLRLTAFAAGCISLILMQSLLGKTVEKHGNLFALAVFALGNYTIYYSAELKPYSSDVLLCLILLLAFQRHVSQETERRDFVLLAALGILALCFSYPALFVLAGLAPALLFYYRGNKKKLVWTALSGTLWAGAFLALYLLLLRHQTQDPYLIGYWNDLLSFMPMPPWRDIAWFSKSLVGLAWVVAGLSPVLALIIPIYIFGLWGFGRERKWSWVLMLTLPVGLNVFASGFQKYPFHGRLILYLLPLVLIVLGKGMDVLVHLIRNRVVANIAFAALVVLLLRPAIPTINSYLFTHSYLQDDLKPALEFIKDNHQDGDMIYLYHYVQQPYAYYAPLYDLETLPVVLGQNNSQAARKYQTELSALPRGRRIWFLFSSVNKARVRKGENRNEREYILNYLTENGVLLSEFYSLNNVSSAHLLILK